jgi:hypothetical protein
MGQKKSRENAFFFLFHAQVVLNFCFFCTQDCFDFFFYRRNGSFGCSKNSRIFWFSRFERMDSLFGTFSNH